MAEETPVAITHDGSTYAVLMATPADVDDLALGFSFTEGVIGGVPDVDSLEIVPHADGIEARMWLVPGRSQPLAERRRAIVGPTGCGLCGVESLEAANRPPPSVKPVTITATEIGAAVAALPGFQPLGAETRAVHAAGLWRPGTGMVAVREDVGRHNALDKLAGALLRAGEDASGGIIVLSSRVSIEMVEKAARIGAGAIAAVSAPTARAVAAADAARLILAAVVRADGFELFTHAGRVT